MFFFTRTTLRHQRPAAAPCGTSHTPRRKAQTALQHKHLATASCSGTSNQAPKRKHATLLIQDIEVRTPLASLSGKNMYACVLTLVTASCISAIKSPNMFIHPETKWTEREWERRLERPRRHHTFWTAVCMCMCVCVRMCVPACVLPCAYVAHSATSWPLLHQVSPNNGYCMIQ